MKKNLVQLILILVILHTSLSILKGQEAEKSKFEQLIEKVKSPEFNLGLLIQFIADYQSKRILPGYNGFSLGSARLILKGQLDQGFGYLLQTNFIKSPALLDAMISYSFSEYLTFKTGLFKTPFSGEFLIFGGDIDFVNRSQVVRLLAPGRQIGIQVSSGIFDKRLGGSIGIFNGNTPRFNINDNNKYLIAGRLTLSENSFLAENGILHAAFNMAYSEDKEISFSDFAHFPIFEGKRYVYGTDVRLELYNFLISGEYILANYEANMAQDLAESSITLDGYYLTFGYHILKNFQILFRLDSFYAHKLLYNNELFVFGLNFWPNSFSELQLNILIDQNKMDMNNQQVLVNTQISF